MGAPPGDRLPAASLRERAARAVRVAPLAKQCGEESERTQTGANLRGAASRDFGLGEPPSPASALARRYQPRGRSGKSPTARRQGATAPPGSPARRRRSARSRSAS